MAQIADINQGDSRNIDLTFYESDGVTPINLTGGTVIFTADTDKALSVVTSAAIRKTVTSHTAPLSGQTRVTLLPTDTDIAAGTYYADARFIASDPNVVVSMKQSKFKILENNNV